MHTDIIMTIIAAVMYFIQPLVNSIHYPKNERRSYYVMMVLSPLFITYASLHSASALSVYWAISATFLIIQMHFAHSHYAKVGKIEGEKLRQRIETKRQTTSRNILKHFLTIDKINYIKAKRVTITRFLFIDDYFVLNQSYSSKQYDLIILKCVLL